MNIHKGYVKVLFDSKFALNSPTSALNSKKKKKKKRKKGKVKRRKIELIRLRRGSFYC